MRIGPQGVITRRRHKGGDEGMGLFQRRASLRHKQGAEEERMVSQLQHTHRPVFADATDPKSTRLDHWQIAGVEAITAKERLDGA